MALLGLQQKTEAQANFKQPKNVDTTGMANIEGKLDLLKTIVNDITQRITNCSALDSIKMSVFSVGDIAGSIINDMIPVFDNFNALHPEQYEPVKNIADLSDLMIKAKDIAKVKKYNQKMITEYNNLVKAK
jgi:hypothetical protein